MARQGRPFGWREKGIIAGAIIVVLGVAIPLWLNFAGSPDTPAGKPASDFPEGSRTAYSAQFKDWKTPQTAFGSLALGTGDSYILKPLSNHWMGGDLPAPMPPLENDFVVDVKFRILSGDPTLQFQLTGTSDHAEVVTLYLSWQDGSLSYHLEKGRMKRGAEPLAHSETEEIIAERAFVSASVAGHDWSSGGKLTLKREGKRMQFFLNDHFLQDFGISNVAFDQMYIGAAQKSEVEISSIEARLRP